MLLNQFLVIFRTLKRNLVYSSINIVGFAISLACCFIVGVYVKTEFSYESFHVNKDRIYRFIPRSAENGELSMQTWTPTGLAPTLLNTFPADIENVTRTNDLADNVILKDGDRDIAVDQMIMADNSFFNIFSFQLIRGDRSKALTRPLTMVIARSVAETNYGTEDPIGKVVKYDSYDLEITGIFEDVPLNSHLQFDAVVSFVSLQNFTSRWNQGEDMLNNFSSWNYSTYVLTTPNVDIADLEQRSSVAFFEQYAKGRTRPADAMNHWLQPLNDIHFTKDIKGDSATGNLTYVYMAISLGIVILLIACFNFTNLSTAMAMRRAKEIGLRKTLGALRPQLVGQFLGEAFAQVTISLVVAVIFVKLVLGIVQQAFGIKLIEFSVLEYTLFFAGLIIVTTIVAGSYPAFYLSAFKPARVLKGNSNGDGKSFFRNTLIVFQFATSVFLLACSFVVFMQLNFIRTKDLGFDKERVITFYCNPQVKDAFEPFKNSLLKHPEVRDVALSSQRLGTLQAYWRYSFPNGEVEGSQAMTTMIVSENFLDFMGMEIKEGRKLSTKYASDMRKGFMVNEAFVETYGLEKPLSTELFVDSSRRGLIVGVIKDFYFQSLHNKVTPLVVRMDPGNTWLVSVKLAPGNLSDAIATVEQEWKTASGGAAFGYRFLDDYIDESYLSDEHASTFLMTLTGFAVLIAGLGLVGLTSFMTIQRRKEIGIRKVLGSSVYQLVRLFASNIMRLLAFSFLLAIPLAWYAANEWLQNFAYHVAINPIVLIAACSIVTLFALSIIGFQTASAAQENPTKALRSE
jgi:putative ABC transport system permease protein